MQKQWGVEQHCAENQNNRSWQGVQPAIAEVCSARFATLQPCFTGLQPALFALQPCITGIQPVLSTVQPFVAGLQPAAFCFGWRWRL